jgi:hypothetical protein
MPSLAETLSMSTLSRAQSTPLHVKAGASVMGDVSTIVYLRSRAATLAGPACSSVKTGVVVQSR